MKGLLGRSDDGKRYCRLVKGGGFRELTPLYGPIESHRLMGPYVWMWVLATPPNATLDANFAEGVWGLIWSYGGVWTLLTNPYRFGEGTQSGWELTEPLGSVRLSPWTGPT